MCLRVFGRGKERRERKSGKGNEKGRFEGGRRQEEEERTGQERGMEKKAFSLDM